MAGSPPFALLNKNRNSGIFVYKKGYGYKDRTASRMRFRFKKPKYEKTANTALLCVP